jgi:hypothetical protein
MSRTLFDADDVPEARTNAPTPSRPRRDTIVPVRLTKGERDPLGEVARDLDICLSTYMRQAVLSRPLPPRRAVRPIPEVNRETYHALGRLASDVNVIARRMAERRREPGASDVLEALELVTEKLQQRLREAGTERFGGPEAERVTVDQLADALLVHMKNQNRASVDKIRCHLKPVLVFFAGRPTMDVTAAALGRYQRQRLDAGKAPATVNREVHALRRAFNVAAHQTPPLFPKHLVPYFPSLPVDNVRSGFFERAEVEALLQHVARGSPARPSRISGKSGAMPFRPRGCPQDASSTTSEGQLRMLIRAGVDATTAMKVSGHKTRSMLLRYNIVTERETADALLRADAYLSTQPTGTENEKGQLRDIRADGARKSLKDQGGVGSSGRIRTEKQASTPADSDPLDPDVNPTWATVVRDQLGPILTKKRDS